MTVRELIKELMDYDLNKDIFVATDKEYQHKDGYKVKGRTFHITGIKNFAGCVDIIFDDWRYDNERQMDN